ncbi:MAG: LysR family transcriptional regulator [Panacagrimonas sp.]
MDPLKFDLNLLRIFHRMMLDRKVSAAAEALGVTQPAVSNALKRLRDLTGDDLFTRSSQGMQPTVFASQIAEPIGYALSTIDGTLNQPARFDPATARHTFHLGLTDIGEVYLLPRLMEETSRSAPNVRFTSVRGSFVSLREQMESGDIDLAVGLLPQLQGNFFHRRLMRQDYVLCLRKGHPLADKTRWTLKDYVAQEHVVVVSHGTGHGNIDTLMARKGIVRNVRLTVPHFMAVGHVLQATDMVATVPEAFSRLIEQAFGLLSLAHPAGLPTVNIDAYWHRRLHRDPANLWLRKLMVELFAA